MNYPFSVKQVIRFTAAVVLVATMFTGCFKKEDAPDTQPSTGGLNLVDTQPASSEQEQDTTPTEESTPATTEAQKKENVAIVKETVGVRASPSKESNVLSQLNAGDEVEVNRVEPNGGSSWAYIPLRGWVDVQYLDMTNVTIGNASSTPAATTPAATAPTSAATTATTANTGNNNTTGNTANNTTTANGKKGVVTAKELNIRESGSTTANAVGQYTYGARITILETSNGWGRTDKGWVSLTYVYQDGTTGTNTAKGLVTGTTLNVRSGPGTEYDAVATYGNLTRVNILEQITVGKTTWGCTKDGWISLDYVYVDGTSGDGAGTGTVTGDKVNIRSGPGTKYDAVTSVSAGDEIEIYAQFTIGDDVWGCTDKGWISMDYVGIG